LDESCGPRRHGAVIRNLRRNDEPFIAATAAAAWGTSIVAAVGVVTFRYMVAAAAARIVVFAGDEPMKCKHCLPRARERSGSYVPPTSSTATDTAAPATADVATTGFGRRAVGMFHEGVRDWVVCPDRVMGCVGTVRVPVPAVWVAVAARVGAELERLTLAVADGDAVDERLALSVAEADGLRDASLGVSDAPPAERVRDNTLRVEADRVEADRTGCDALCVDDGCGDGLRDTSLRDFSPEAVYDTLCVDTDICRREGLTVKDACSDELAVPDAHGNSKLPPHRFDTRRTDTVAGSASDMGIDVSVEQKE
jgi:hypothetical protein